MIINLDRLITKPSHYDGYTYADYVADNTKHGLPIIPEAEFNSLATEPAVIDISDSICNLEVALDLAYEMDRDTESLRSDLAFIREWQRLGCVDPSRTIKFTLIPGRDFYDRAELICGI